jgi:hypothetical protein
MRNYYENKILATKLHEETRRKKICVICVICGFLFSLSPGEARIMSDWHINHVNHFVVKRRKVEG